jgi:NADH-quinone oxidoreductase subunit K
MEQEIITLNHYLILGAIVFCIGIFGALKRKSAIGILISLELVLNAVNINMVAFSHYITPARLTGEIFAVFIIAVAAAEAVIGLAIVFSIYRNFKTVEVNEINLLKW